MGFGQGFQPIGGYCWGARKYSRVRSAFWTCTAIGACVSVVLGALMFILAPQLLGLFMKAEYVEETMRIGKLMIRTQCITLFPHVWVMISNGLYQALGRPKEATVLGLSRQVICLVPLVFILSRLFGVNGLACAQSAADLASMLIAIPLVTHQTRIIKRLNDGDEPPAGYGLSKAAANASKEKESPEDLNVLDAEADPDA